MISKGIKCQQTFVKYWINNERRKYYKAEKTWKCFFLFS